MRDLEGVHNYLPISPFRRDSLVLPVRTVQSQTFMERIVIKVHFIHSQLKICQYFNKKRPSHSLGTILGVSTYSFFVFLCVQSVTVSMECVTPVLRVMGSVCVNHRTADHAVTEVNLDFTLFSEPQTTL